MDGEHGPAVAKTADSAVEGKRRKRTLAELIEAANTRPLLNPEEMAARLNIGLSTAYRLLEKGVIPTVRIPGTNCLRVRRAVLDGLGVKWESGRRRGKGAQP